MKTFKTLTAGSSAWASNNRGPLTEVIFDYRNDNDFPFHIVGRRRTSGFTINVPDDNVASVNDNNVVVSLVNNGTIEPVASKTKSKVETKSSQKTNTTTKRGRKTLEEAAINAGKIIAGKSCNVSRKDAITDLATAMLESDDVPEYEKIAARAILGLD